MARERVINHELVLDLYASGAEYLAIGEVAGATQFNARMIVLRARRAGDPRAAERPKPASAKDARETSSDALHAGMGIGVVSRPVRFSGGYSTAAVARPISLARVRFVEERA